MLRQIPKNEAKERFKILLHYCDVLGIHLEPSLQSTKSKIYHTSNVLQTRIIDVLDRSYQDITDPKELDLFLKTRNHDCYKSPYYLIRGEQLQLKTMGFVQAVVPSIFVTSRKQKLYLEYIRNMNLFLEASDNNTRNFYQNQLDRIQYEKKITTNCYNQTNFLHFRFWFFDLDFKIPIPLNDIKSFLAEMGLLPYLAMIVATSPHKYHLYFKSEMIASEAHVAEWPEAIRTADLHRIEEPGYLDQLREVKPNKSGKEWFDVKIRGLPAPHRLHCIPIPIPEDAVLQNGLYYGDNNVYNTYLTMYKEISGVLGSDPKVFNETRCAQLPGFTNPKNGYVANIVYENKDAPVLTTKIARTTIQDNIQAWYAKGYGPLYIEPKNIPHIRIVNNREEVLEKVRDIDIKVEAYSDRFHLELPIPIEEPVKKQKNPLKSKKKPIKKFTLNVMPAGPEEYCRIHDLMDEVKWVKDITGYSNQMLLLFSRFAHKYIDLKNEEQQKCFFSTVITPYLENKVSKDLAASNALDNFFYRFKTICIQNSKKTFVSTKSSKQVLEEYTDINDLEEHFEKYLLSLQPDQTIFSSAHKRLRRIICDHILGYAKVSKIDGKIYFEFQVPSFILNTVHGYANKLKIYKDLGIYGVNDKYVAPVRKNGVLIKAGICKMHTLVLNDRKAKEDILAKKNTEKVEKIEKVEKVEKIEKVEIEKVEKIIDLPKEKVLEERHDVYSLRSKILPKESELAYEIAQRIYEPDNDNIVGLRKILEKPENQRNYEEEGLERHYINSVFIDFRKYQEVIEQNELLSNTILDKKTIDGKELEDIIDFITEIYSSTFTVDMKKRYEELCNKTDKNATDITLINHYKKTYIDQYDNHIKTLELLKTENKKITPKCDPQIIHDFELAKRQLYDILREIDSIITEKEKLFDEFREVVLEDIDENGLNEENKTAYGNFAANIRYLQRDGHFAQYMDMLPPDLRELWEVPVGLQKQENDYVRKIEGLVKKIQTLRQQVPHGPNNCAEAYDFLKKTVSRNPYLLSLLNSL